MKNMYNYLKLLPILLLGFNWGANAQSTVFSYTGVGPQIYTVPVNTYTVVVTALGADGGNDYHGYSVGGNGASVNCALAVTPGQLLNVYVGGKGLTPAVPFAGAAGGFNGGGAGTGNGGGAGGSSDVRYPGTALSDRVIIAGGGGGAGQDASAAPGDNGENGGPGGGLTGGDGFLDYLSETPTGGTQVTGWSILNGEPASPSFGVGGVGGGGGGYWGGFSGYNASLPTPFNGGGGGGGGSDYTDPATVSSVTNIRAGNGAPGTNPGQVTICAPGIAGGIVPAPICVGGTPGTFTDTGGTPGGTWESSNTFIATIVAGTGVASGVAFGNVVITYHANTPCGNAIATVTITVASGASPITGYDTVCVHTTTTLSDPDPGGTWASQFPGVASVIGGVVTGQSVGTSTITYTIPGGCYALADVDVKPALTPITGPSSFVCIGIDSLILSDATTGGTWTSGFTSIATVDSSTGVVKGTIHGGGSSTFIFYTLSGCTTSYFVTANDTAYPITGPNAVCQGDSIALTEFAINGSWAPSSPGIATVSSTGEVTGVAGGISIISYNVNGCPSQIYTVTTNPTPAPIVGITSICIGSTAVVLSDADPLGTWMSSDTTVATISPTGVVSVVTGMVGLTTTITYTLPTSCYTTFLETTNSGPFPITGATSVCQGDTTTLADATPGGTWSSTLLATAQVIDSTGLVTGVAAGAVTISYTLPSGCYSVVSPFTVQPLIPANVTITRYPSSDTLCPNTQVMYVATPANGGFASFKWYLFGVVQPSPLIDTFIYTPIHGDVVIVKMKTSGICSVNDNVADSVSMNVYPDAAPQITITEIAQTDTLHYLGEIHTFFSKLTYGGTAATYQWYSNRLPILGATNSSYSTAVYWTDTFYCQVVGNAPCDSIIHTAVSNALIIGDYLGIANTSNVTNALTLFPNPNNGTLTLSGTINTAVNNVVTVEVSDMLGQIVYTGKVNARNGSLHEQINLGDNVAAGSYLMRVNSGSGSETFHFVVNK